MDAFCRKACGTARTVKPCGPDPPTLGSSRVDHESTRRRGLASPVPLGERGVSRNTIAQGVPDRFGEPVVTKGLCAPLPFPHTRLRVRRAPGIPCALTFPGDTIRKTTGETRRGNAQARSFLTSPWPTHRSEGGSRLRVTTDAAIFLSTR